MSAASDPFYRDSRNVYRVPAFDRLEWLDHGFGSRHSEGWVPGPLATLHQVHSDRCLVVDAAPEKREDGDALITSKPGLYVGVRTADCVPILLVDERRRVVAAVHAGWRGTAAGIAMRAVERMGGEARDVLAAIGPSICGQCYEVGAEVAARFARWFPETPQLTKVDLAEANRRQLLAAGLPESRIFCAGLCTICTVGEFHSFRRERDAAGRMVSAVAVKGI